MLCVRRTWRVPHLGDYNTKIVSIVTVSAFLRVMQDVAF